MGITDQLKNESNTIQHWSLASNWCDKNSARMKTFKEYILVDEHQHDSFDKACASYMIYVGRQNR
jgi:hypothetical protein